MNSTDEFAEQYTPKERLRLILLGLICGGAFILVWKKWALPFWAHFAKNSPCYELAGINGTAIVMYSIFVGLPLVAGFVVALVSTKRGIRIIRERQVPYKGEKVFHATRIKRGSKAVVIGWMHVLIPLVFVAIALWGAPKARELAGKFDASRFDRSQCAADLAWRGS